MCERDERMHGDTAVSITSNYSHLGLATIFSIGTI